MADTVEHVSVVAGMAAPVVTLGAIVLATLLSPTFAWTGNALSNLGSPVTDASTPTTRLVFNGGLLCGAVVGAGFGYALLRAVRNVVELAGVGVFGLVVILMGLIGVFPQGTPEHVPVAITFYVLLSWGLWIYGVGNVRAGARERGLVTIGAGILNTGVWAVWIATGPLMRPGLAIPELVGAMLLAGWTLATALDARTRLATDRNRVSSDIQSQ
ncbi:MAG: DUF998 domain-containing protein [Halorientalis sp.]